MFDQYLTGGAQYEQKNRVSDQRNRKRGSALEDFRIRSELYLAPLQADFQRQKERKAHQSGAEVSEQKQWEIPSP